MRHDGIDFHLEGLHEMGLPIPQPFRTKYHEVASAA
jgi:predicted RNase H-like HicB family nuclease